MARRAACFRYRFDHELGFRSRNQHIWRHPNIPPVELLVSGDVLGRLALETLMQITAEMDPLDLAQLSFRVSIKKFSPAAERVREQHFGGEPRRRDTAIFQEFGPLEQGV